LPNAPGLIFPGHNQNALKKKRDFLLEKLLKNHTIDKTTYELSLEEPLVERPHELPNIAPHLVERIARTTPNKRQVTTIDYYLQERVQEVIAKFYRHYKRFEVHNLCALVVDVQSREVLAYVGNSPTDEQHQKDVNIIHRPRSTGSVLKPFLYTAMLDSGELLPQELVGDIPTHIGGYSPENFENTYEGAVPADEALYRSLNIPFVLLLRQYGISRFYQQLQKLRLRSINRSPDHYGLSLILGGAECSLWELAQAYANMGYELNEYTQTGKYRSHAFQRLTYLRGERDYGTLQEEKNHFSAGAIYKTFEALTQVNRPSFDSAWRYYTSSRKISWKTGTSFGNRDAWSIGLTSRYLVGVWVGNASGEGRPELTGVGTAAPVMLEIFQLLKKDKWFDTPWEDLQKVEVCALSGMIASDLCPKKTIWVPHRQLQTSLCKYHRWVHLSTDGLWQVNSNCEQIANIRSESWFVLPPLMEWFYKKKHPSYQVLPPLREDCQEGDKQQVLDFIYPKHGATLHPAKGLGGSLQPIIARVAYKYPGKLFWYLDNTFLGETLHFHDMKLYLTPGEHLLKCMDSRGNEKTILITTSD
jgi:penicillin-binding protein 1C